MVDRSRLRKWAALVSAVMVGVGGFVAWLAGLTVDLPQALPTWEAFAKSIRGELPAATFYLVLFGLTAANLWFWLTDRRRPEAVGPPTPEQTSIAPPVQEPEPPLPVPSPPEPMASQESAERLLELFRHWDEAFLNAAAVLKQEVCTRVTREAGVSTEILLLTYAIREYPYQIYVDKMFALRIRFEHFVPRETPQRDLNDLKAALLDTVRQCNFHFLFWINKGGAVVWGEKLLSTPAYIGFYLAYEAALKATDNLRFHSELGPLARSLREMETRPLKSIDPASSTAS